MPLHKIPLCSFNYVGDEPLGGGSFEYNFIFNMRKAELLKTLEFEENKEIIKNNNSNILQKNLQAISKNNIKYFNKSTVNILKENKKNMMNKYNSCISKKNIKLLKYIRELNINKFYIKNLKNIRHFNINKKNFKLMLRSNGHDIDIQKAKILSRILDYSLLKNLTQKNLFITRKLDINKTTLKLIERKNNLKLLCKIKVDKFIDIKQKLDMYKYKPVYFLDIKRDKSGNLINVAYFIDIQQDKNLSINKKHKLIEFNKTISLTKSKNLKTIIRFNKHNLIKNKFNLLNKKTNNNLNKIKLDKFIFRNKLKDISKNKNNKLIIKPKNNNISKNATFKLIEKIKKVNMVKQDYIFIKNTTTRKLIKQNNISLKKYMKINILKNNNSKLLIKNNMFKINKSSYKSLVFNKNIYIDKANLKLFLEKSTNYFNKKNTQILDKETSINIAKNKIYFSNKYEKNIYKFKDNYSLNKYPIWINKNNPGHMLKKYPINILKGVSKQLNNPSFKDIRIERNNTFLEVTKRWWVLSPSDPFDLKILPDDYNYFDNPIKIKNSITDKIELLYYHPISYMPYLEDRKGIDLSYGTNEIDLSIAIMIEMVNIVGMIIEHNVSDFKHCSGQEAVEFMMELILDWFNLNSTKQAMLQKGSYEHYLRSYRWIRWEAEKVWFIADSDKSVFKGYYYLQILFKELTEYLRLHHFNEVPLWRNLSCMDIERNFNRQALNGDLIKKLDKNKGYRHYSIDNQQF